MEKYWLQTVTSKLFHFYQLKFLKILSCEAFLSLSLVLQLIRLFMYQPWSGSKNAFLYIHKPSSQSNLSYIRSGIQHWNLIFSIKSVILVQDEIHHWQQCAYLCISVNIPEKNKSLWKLEGIFGSNCEVCVKDANLWLRNPTVNQNWCNSNHHSLI